MPPRSEMEMYPRPGNGQFKVSTLMSHAPCVCEVEENYRTANRKAVKVWEKVKHSLFQQKLGKN